ncbi:PAS domain S-box protein [Candidatus Peregrinibacteria bacterium]|nr:PAS domain S-box protein [Candidatus Peregrinibacteria bacterium]
MRSMSLRKKFGILFLSVFLVNIGGLGLVYHYQSLEKTDTAVVDASGRNRMLSQRIGFYAEQTVRKGSEEAKAELQRVIDLHDVSFYALKNGGVAPGIADDVLLPPTTKDILPLVWASEELWQQYKENAGVIAREPTVINGETNPQVAAAIDFIEKNGSEMLRRNNEMVMAYVRSSQMRHQNILLIFSVVILIFVMTAGFVSYMTRRSIIQPLQRLGVGIRKFGAGDMDYRIDVKTGDEVGDIARFFNEMAAKLKKSYSSLAEKVSEAEREAENVKKFYEAAEAAAEQIIITDVDGKILYANKATQQITGFPVRDIIGKRPSLWGKQMSSTFYAAMWKSIKDEKQTFHGEIKNRRKDGREYFADLYISPIFDANNNVKFFVGIERDITKEKELEKLRVDFLALASHQLCTPLSGIKWLIDTLNRAILGPVTPKQREYLRQIYRVNERMIKLVFDMLNALRLDSSDTVAKREKLSVTDLYEETLVMMEPVAKDRGVVLRNAAPKRAGMMMETDAVMLRNIIECFVSNAIQYSSGGQEVVLDAQEDATGITLSVQDSGIGIPATEREKIFERFYRASNAKKMRPDGTGLGLYIAAMLAKRIGVAITFTSEEGRGSSFRVRVPLRAG